MATAIDQELLFKLIKHSTSLAVVSDFLKRKQLHYSAGSWEDMFSLRLGPYLDDAKISVAELVDLLRTVEEYGRQHIFLFRTTQANAGAIMDRQTVSGQLRALGRAQLLTTPLLYDFPAQPSIADVRWVQVAGNDVELIIKEIQAREHYRLLRIDRSATGMVKVYELEQERGVNVARLHRSGQLELRIAARAGSQRYNEDLQNFRHRIQRLIPAAHFAEVSLSGAKERLWQDRARLSSRIRFSEVAARNDDDFILKAAAGSQQANVSSNAASVSSMENFVGQRGRLEGYNMWFAKEHTPSGRDVHFLLSGDVNEFAITANCTKEDYDYVLSELRALNA